MLNRICPILGRGACTKRLVIIVHGLIKKLAGCKPKRLIKLGLIEVATYSMVLVIIRNPIGPKLKLFLYVTRYAMILFL
tara:strand:+ start:2554 stop:2790 length:237 start_codon:yes stop_codon:yes gene_type:complete